MPRALAAAGLALWLGTTLLLAELRWFSRPPLAERLRPYSSASAGFRGPMPAGTGTGAALRELARSTGDGLVRLLGVSEPLERRLRRIHSPLDPTAFRVRQVSWAGAGALAGAAVATAARATLGLAGLLVAGGALLAFLLVEQQLASASARRQRRTFLELPVVSEQLGMLMGAGYSLGAALNRIASRGTGACAEDLGSVCARIRHGLGEAEALREWADRMGVDALSRLVSILALNRDAADLGRLISEEARSIRRAVQRELLEQIERRSQQVWIPVTVATLVPGTILLAVPFIEALRLFSRS